jgi:hypothetical protein
MKMGGPEMAPHTPYPPITLAHPGYAEALARPTA